METIRGTERDQHIEFLRSKRVAQTWFLWWQAPDFCSFSPLTVIQMQLCLAGQMRQTFAPHMWGPFYFCKHIFTHRLRLAKPRSPSKFSMLKSCKLLCENTFFSHTKGFSLRVDWDKSVCGEINWFPFLVCRVGGILQEEGAGTGKVGEEINWSHYVTLCVICFGSAPKTPSSIHGWG